MPKWTETWNQSAWRNWLGWWQIVFNGWIQLHQLIQGESRWGLLPHELQVATLANTISDLLNHSWHFLNMNTWYVSDGSHSSAWSRKLYPSNVTYRGNSFLLPFEFYDSTKDHREKKTKHHTWLLYEYQISSMQENSILAASTFQFLLDQTSILSTPNHLLH